MDRSPPVGEHPDKAWRVRAMFDSISGRYDLLNRVLSLGIDRAWRAEAVRLALVDRPNTVLDVATGTGDFALTLKRYALERSEYRGRDVEVVGVDFVPSMLEIARRKARQQRLEIFFVEGDALSLPYGDASFDALTCAFGFRNFADYRRGLEEFYRVLRPGGRVVILEFPPPPDGWLGRLYGFYFRRVLPWLGGLISGRPEAYAYLPESVFAFPKPPDLADLMLGVGFGVRYRILTGGLVAIHVGSKPVVDAGAVDKEEV